MCIWCSLFIHPWIAFAQCERLISSWYRKHYTNPFVVVVFVASESRILKKILPKKREKIQSIWKRANRIRYWDACLCACWRCESVNWTKKVLYLHKMPSHIEGFRWKCGGDRSRRRHFFWSYWWNTKTAFKCFQAIDILRSQLSNWKSIWEIGIFFFFLAFFIDPKPDHSSTCIFEICFGRKLR